MLSTVAGTLGASYLSDAENILGALNGYLDTAANGEAVLLDGYPGGLTGTNTALIFGDYYFTEALLRLQDVIDGQPGWSLYSPAATSVVPEPSTWAMMLLGFAGLGFVGYRRRAKSSRART
jgi:PEP-CTERM motif